MGMLRTKSASSTLSTHDEAVVLELLRDGPDDRVQVSRGRRPHTVPAHVGVIVRRRAPADHEGGALARLVVARDVADQDVLACLQRQGQPGPPGLTATLPSRPTSTAFAPFTGSFAASGVRLQYDQFVRQLARVAHGERYGASWGADRHRGDLELLQRDPDDGLLRARPNSAGGKAPTTSTATTATIHLLADSAPFGGGTPDGGTLHALRKPRIRSARIRDAQTLKASASRPPAPST